MLPSHAVSGPFVSHTKTFAVLVLVCAVAGIVGVHFSRSLQGTDFPDFYCAARMLAEGQGHQLYNADAQRQCQALYTGRIGTLYIHPPFEALLYLTVAWLPLRHAYLLWSLLSAAVLLLAALRLATAQLFPWDWRYCIAASVTFVPVLLCSVQGQDSLLLFLLVVLAFTNLRRGSAFAAGCWFGLGLFKFQIVLPMVLVLLLTQSTTAKIGVAKGFFLIAAALAGLSAAVCGLAVFSAYANFLIHLPIQPYAGILPGAMANFRGITFLVLSGDSSPLALTSIAILSLAAFAGTIFAWHNIRPVNPHTSVSSHPIDLAFATTCLFALLVSYHLNPHDLTLLLLPMLLLLRPTTNPAFTSSQRWLTLGLSAILFLPPLHLLALHLHTYAVVAIPITALFAASARLARSGR